MPLATVERPNTEEQQDVDQLIQEAIHSHEILQQQLKPELIQDEQGCERTLFHITDTEGVSIVFRDREELPTFTDKPDDVVTVLSPHEKPYWTPEGAYNNWLTELSEGKPHAHPFERAIQENAEEVRLIGTSTPYGVLDAAKSLIESGVIQADATHLEHITSLRQKLSQEQYDEEVYDLLDSLYAASAVTVNNGEMVYSGEQRDDGLMEVTLALAGSETAQKIVDGKKAYVQKCDEATRQAETKEIQDKTPPSSAEVAELKQPGQAFTEEELKQIADQHLVAVHTTSGKPHQSEEGRQEILPTFAYGERADKKPRNTVHFALNHPVESHIYGNFNNRPYTIIAPVEGLARLNGAPKVLYGVDTYFALNPGEGVRLPEDTIILETTTNAEVPGVEVHENTIQLKVDHLTSEDNRDIARFLLSRYGTVLGGEADTSQPEKQMRELMADMANTSAVGTISLVERERPEKFVTQEQKDIFAAIDDMHALLNDTLVQEGKYPGKTDVTELGYYTDESRSELMVAALARLYTENGLIEKYPNLQATLSEALRQTIVRLETARMGGEKVRSDGDSEKIVTKGFDARVQTLGRSIGLTGGLHTDKPEKMFETKYSSALRAALQAAAPSDVDVSRIPSGTSGYFSWEEYTREAGVIWDALRLASPATRRMAIAAGWLSHAKPGAKVNPYALPGS